MDVTQLEKVRPCGRLETYSTARHHLGFYNNVGLTATYAITSPLGVTIQSLVFAALHYVIAEHPDLSAIPVNEHRSYPDVYFARLPRINLTDCVEFRTCSSPVPDAVVSGLNELLQSQHSRNFKSSVLTSPYWRLVITTCNQDPAQFTASWIFHHALCDGASSMIFHKTFLEGLNKFSRAPHESVESIVSTPPTPLTPPLEDLHPMTISWSFFLKALAGSLAPSYLQRRSRGLWTGPPIAETPMPSHTRIIALSAETTKAFVELCREQKTSVTAVLSTLLAVALFKCVDLPYDEINIDMPISLRPFLDLEVKSLLNAVTKNTSTFRRNDLSDNVKDVLDWNTARRVKYELAREVGKQGADSPVALLKYASNLHNYFGEKIGKLRETTAEVSNLGVYRPQISHHGEATVSPVHPLCREENEWIVGRMVFSQSSSHLGSLISLSAVTGGDGCLVLSFNLPQDSDGNEEGSMRNLHRIPHLLERDILNLTCRPRHAKSTDEDDGVDNQVGELCKERGSSV